MPDTDYASQQLARRTALAALTQPPVIQPSHGGVVATNNGNAVDQTGILSGSVILAVPSVHGGNVISNPGKAFAVSSDTLITDGGTPAISALLPLNPTRTTGYLFLADVVVQGPSAGTQGGAIDIYLDGAIAPNSMLPSFGNLTATSTLYQTIPLFYVAVLSAGSHTLALDINTNGATYTVFSFDLYAFQLGS